MSNAYNTLGSDGPLAQKITGFNVREVQQDLSRAIENAIENDAVLVAEAGTGIGKTFAYLVPAVQSGKRVIISTGTRHLQDQLFLSDIPKITEALAHPVKTALLKGRNNYLCIHRMQLAPHAGFLNREAHSYLHTITTWSKETHTGDISEVTDVPEDSYVWPLVTSTVDNCLGSECNQWDQCHLVVARKKAQDADIVVINHHLLLADMVIREQGFSELLPQGEVFIIDEAHQLYDIASRFFGLSLSSRQIISLARDSIAEQVNDAPDMAEIRDYAEEVERCTQQVRLAFGQNNQRQAWLMIARKKDLVEALEQLRKSLEQLNQILDVAAERSKGLDQCYQRSLNLIDRLNVFMTDQNEPIESEDVLWYETYTKSFMLHATPVNVSASLKLHTDDYRNSWCFTSATLQVNRQFNHFSENMGLEDFESGVWNSPFNYKEQSLLYLPKNLPAPNQSHFTAELIKTVLPVIKASRGHAFLLFTSYRAMYEAKSLLSGAIDFPVLVQGDLPKHSLLAQFRDTPNCVLLGTSSFWEGVDVRGESLSCVVIDKLPFASPGDPLMQARIDAIRQAGGQPFMDYQVPQAVIALKQGVGRLIRDIHDYGVVVIGDPRLTEKAYGKVFLNSLPEMPKTNSLDDVQKFYQTHHNRNKSDELAGA